MKNAFRYPFLPKRKTDSFFDTFIQCPPICLVIIMFSAPDRFEVSKSDALIAVRTALNTFFDRQSHPK